MDRSPARRSRTAVDAEKSFATRGAKSGVPVFVVAAVRLYREGVARLIRDDASLRLIGLGPPDDESLRKIAAGTPCVVLVDVGDVRSGTFARRLAAAAPK